MAFTERRAPVVSFTVVVSCHATLPKRNLEDAEGWFSRSRKQT